MCACFQLSTLSLRRSHLMLVCAKLNQSLQCQKHFNNENKLVNGYHIMAARYHWLMQNTPNDSCGISKKCWPLHPNSAEHFNRKWIEIIRCRPLRLKIWRMGWIELISNPCHSLPFTICHIKQFLHALLIFDFISSSLHLIPVLNRVLSVSRTSNRVFFCIEFISNTNFYSFSTFCRLLFEAVLLPCFQANKTHRMQLDQL